MGKSIYFIALILAIIWAIGFIVYGIGGFMHVLIVIAFVLVLQGIIQGRK